MHSFKYLVLIYERICRFCTTRQVEDEILHIMKCYILILIVGMNCLTNCILSHTLVYLKLITANNDDADFCKPTKEFINEMFQ